MTENDFSLRLSKLREARGVSARDMSLSMGQNAGYIYNIEAGKSKPSLSGFFYICEYLDITPYEFFDIQNNDPTKIKEVTNELKKLDNRQLEIISLLIKEMKK